MTIHAFICLMLYSPTKQQTPQGTSQGCSFLYPTPRPTVGVQWVFADWVNENGRNISGRCLQGGEIISRCAEHGENTVFSKWCWESWKAACKSVTWEHTLIPYTKMNSKWLEDNVRRDTTKLEGITGKTFSDISCTNVFLGQSPKAMAIKTKTHGM